MGIYRPDGSYLMEKPAWLDLPSTEGRMNRTVTINWLPKMTLPTPCSSDITMADIEQIVFEVGRYRNGAPKWRLISPDMLARFEALVAKERHWFW